MQLCFAAWVLTVRTIVLISWCSHHCSEPDMTTLLWVPVRIQLEESTGGSCQWWISPELGTPRARDGSCPSVGVCAGRAKGVKPNCSFLFGLELSLQVSFAKLIQCTKTYTSLYLSCQKAVPAFAELQNWSTQLVQEIVEETTAASLSVPSLLCFSWRSVVLEDRIWIQFF